MKADWIAQITSDVARLGTKKEADAVVVSSLTPQAALLRKLADEVKGKTVEGDWDVKPHPLLVQAAPTRAQFDAEDTAPVCIMRNPIAGKQVCGVFCCC